MNMKGDYGHKLPWNKLNECVLEKTVCMGGKSTHAIADKLPNNLNQK